MIFMSSQKTLQDEHVDKEKKVKKHKKEEKTKKQKKEEKTKKHKKEKEGKVKKHKKEEKEKKTNKHKKEEKKKKVIAEITKPEDTGSKAIVLFDYQQVHVAVIKQILNESAFAFDLSMLGTGKTYTTCYMYTENEAHRYKHIIVIAPVSVKTKWRMVSKEYGIKIDSLLSFCELRTVKFKQPKHGLLIRRDFMKQITNDRGVLVDIEKVDFACTQKYNDFVKDGVLLVIDEIQNVKNMNSQLDACKELIRPIVEAFNVNKNSPSRVILLSGSPVDKRIQTIHFYKLLNIMVNDRLSVYNPQTFKTMWRGMKEIEDYCSSNFGKENISAIKTLSGMHPTYESYMGYILELYCYNLFRKLIIPHRSNAMEPIKIPANITKRNAFYKLGEVNDVKLLKEGISKLAHATRFEHETHAIDMGHDGADSLRGITLALMMIETAKINLFVRVAREKLKESPNNKVVICVNYSETINDLVTALAEYFPLKLNGSMNYIDRANVLTLFQAQSAAFRLLIGNITVCSSGIDLDDQDGKFPRTCFVSPNYSTILLYQLSHRFHRINTKSDSLIHFVLCKEATELPILNALARKSNIMKEITEIQVKNGVIFPGDYQKWEEPHI